MLTRRPTGRQSLGSIRNQKLNRAECFEIAVACNPGAGGAREKCVGGREADAYPIHSQLLEGADTYCVGFAG
jgi:hypothetical protein